MQLRARALPGRTCSIEYMSAASGNGSKAAPWVLVAGGFHRQGGMDKANAALAEYLSGSGVPVHLVSYRVDSRLAANPGVTVHRVLKPAGSFFLAQWQLDRLGRAVANKVTALSPRARVVVNGVNCDWPDINWVHWVHREWLSLTPGAPPWFRAKNRLEAWISVRRELRVLRRARLLLANSERTRLDLLRDLTLAPERVHHDLSRFRFRLEDCYARATCGGAGLAQEAAGAALGRVRRRLWA